MTADDQLAALIAGCDQEPIRTPGAIQPHGALLVLRDDGSDRCEIVSANTDEIIGISSERLLGEPLSGLLGSEWTEAMLTASPGDAVRLITRRGPHEAAVRVGGGRRFLEIEPVTNVDLDDHWRLFNVLRGFHGATTTTGLLDQAVLAVRDITGFDRVLVYRFDESWNGEVVAEAIGPGTPSLLGLRFPASDIPQIARALYVRNRLRLIPDSEAESVPLLAADGVSVDDLDLTDVGLRAVSPVHLQYNRNMGVRASMSAAIVVDGGLWGLVTCHRLREPGRLPLRSRNAVDLVARTTSTVLAVLLDAEEARRRVGHLQHLDRIVEAFSQQTSAEPDEVLIDAGDLLLAIVAATGASVVSGRGIQRVGACPSDEVLVALVDEARRRPRQELVANELAEVDDRLAEHGETAAGAIVVRVTGPEDRWLVWVRPETARTIRWGGNPNAKADVAAAPGATRLGPRASFEEYIEVVRGKSLRWTDQEVEAARLVARRLSDQYAGRALREAEIAATLQRTLMLERFPEVPGIDGAGHYVPSRREPIGGDWYDVFFRPQRHPTLVLGDVAGHGVEAAATMAQLRHALRAYILRAPSIAVAVSRLNDLIMQALPKEMATSIVAELDPVLRRITMVNAGHLPALVIDDDGAHLVESERGLALGIRVAASYRANTITLPAGAAFVAYSDGLIESRTRTIDEGLDLLVREAAACSGLDTAEDIAARLVDRVGSQSDTGDDLTVVVVRFVDPDDGDDAVEVGTPRP